LNSIMYIRRDTAFPVVLYLYVYPFKGWVCAITCDCFPKPSARVRKLPCDGYDDTTSQQRIGPVYKLF
jgi:hypothetical protein